MFMLNYIYIAFTVFLKLVHRFNQLQSRSNVMISEKTFTLQDSRRSTLQTECN